MFEPMRRKARTLALTAAAATIVPLVMAIAPAASADTTIGQEIANVALGQMASPNLGPCGAGPAYAGYYATGTAQSNSCADPGSNAGPAQPWCADFAGWVWQKAGVSPLTTDETDSGNTTLDDGAASFYNYGQLHGTLHTSSSYVPQPGDAIVYNYGTDGNATNFASHVAIVTSADPGAGTVDSVAGNSGGGYVQTDTNEPMAVGDNTEWGAQISAYVSPANGSSSVATTAAMSTFVTGNGSLYGMTDENGVLHEVIQNLSTGTWLNNSPNVTSSGGVSSWYDAANDSTYTFNDENGTLYEVIQNMSTGQWYNNSPGIPVSGDISVFSTGNGSLYGMVNENGTLYEVIQNLTTGAWLNNSTGIAVTGGIATWYDAAKSSTYMFVDENGSLYEVIQNMSTGQWYNTSPGIPASGEISMFVTGNGSIYGMVNESGTLYEVIQNLTTGTWLNNSPGITSSGGISSWYDAAKDSTYTFNDENGTLYEVLQNMSTGQWYNTSPGIPA